MSPTRAHLVLMGLRGSGKSTVGAEVARRRRVTFTDLDVAVLDHLECATVKEAWTRLGEDAFREAETVVLTALLASGGRVVALGGGTPTAPGAPEAINDARRLGRAVVVYLRCQPAVLVARLTGKVGDDRPPLLGTDTLAEMATVFAHRDGMYRGLADVVLEGGMSVEATVEAVLSAWGAGSGGE